MQLGEMIHKLEKTEENAKQSYDKYSMLVSQQTSHSEDTTQLKTVMKTTGPPVAHPEICAFTNVHFSLSTEIERTGGDDQRTEGPDDRTHHHQPQLPEHPAEVEPVRTHLGQPHAKDTEEHVQRTGHGGRQGEHVTCGAEPKGECVADEERLMDCDLIRLEWGFCCRARQRDQGM